MEFTSRDFKEGFWYYRPDEAFPPQGLADPDNYMGQERLSIIGGPTTPTRDQAKLTKQWIEILPSLNSVRILWVSNKVSQVMLEAICGMSNLEALWIKWSGIKSLESISKLNCLESLHIGSSTKIGSIEPLMQLRRLKWLELENIKMINDLTPIGECRQLVGLGITGSIWTTQRVQSLSPLSNLSELRYLNICNLRSADKTLKPLFSLNKLQRLYRAKWWQQSEIDELERNNPQLKYLL